MNKIPVTRNNYRINSRVIRGRDWSWGSQDHDKDGKPVTGTVTSHPGRDTVRVKWDNGDTNSYACSETKQDLYFFLYKAPLTRAFGWDIGKYRPNHGGFSFGCGEVQVTKEDMEGWLKMEQIAERHKLEKEEMKEVMYQLLQQD